MFVACGIWCLADVSSVSPSSEQTASEIYGFDQQRLIWYVCRLWDMVFSRRFGR